MGDGAIRAKGRVTGPAGSSLVGAKVYLDDPGRLRYPASFETTTAQDGSFHLSTTVAPGHYAIPLIIEADGLKPARLDVQTLTDNVVEARLADAASDNDSIILAK
ncbi:MAG: carboxypeptidase regulatory-like domain-containing protein [Brevundimonas sp.]|nr:MAG: carboxypeptidase regulatory-like domain-containing protein [Brevundimonas sp.]